MVIYHVLFSAQALHGFIITFWQVVLLRKHQPKKKSSSAACPSFAYYAPRHGNTGPVVFPECRFFSTHQSESGRLLSTPRQGPSTSHQSSCRVGRSSAKAHGQGNIVIKLFHRSVASMILGGREPRDSKIPPHLIQFIKLTHLFAVFLTCGGQLDYLGIRSKVPFVDLKIS